MSNFFAMTLAFVFVFAFASRITFSLAETHPSPSSTQWHEDEMSEFSSPLFQNFVQGELLDSTLRPQKEKIERMMQKIEKRKEELTRILYFNHLAEGKKRSEVREKMEEEDSIIALNLILKDLQLLMGMAEGTALYNPVQVVRLSKRVLHLDRAFMDNAKKKLITQLQEDFRVAMFDKHLLYRDPDKKELSTNLIDPKKGKTYLSRDELKKRIEAGEDISLLDPPDSSFWTKPKQKISDINLTQVLELNHRFEKDTTFVLDSLVSGGHSPKIRVEKKGKLGNLKIKKWRCKFDEEVNSEIAATRILKLVGFNADMFFYAPRMKVYLKKKYPKAQFKKEWLKVYKSESRWNRLVAEEGENSQGEYVVFHEASCRPSLKNEKRIGPFHLSLPGNETLREIRGNMLVQAFFGGADIKNEHNNKTKLIETSGDNKSEPWKMISLIHDVGNSFGKTIFTNNPNSFSHILINKIYHSHNSTLVKLNYKRYHHIGIPNPFTRVHYTDAKWMARYLAQITKTQMAFIMSSANWPLPLQKLYLEKMSHRRNDIVRAFELEKEGFELWPTQVPWPASSLATYNDGKWIRNGRLVRNFREKDYYYPGDYLKTIFDLYRLNKPTGLDPFLKWDREEDKKDLGIVDDKELTPILETKFTQGSSSARSIQFLQGKDVFLIKSKLHVEEQTREKLQKTFDLINTTVNDANFVQLTPSLYNDKRYGELFITIHLKFYPRALLCLLEGKSCQGSWNDWKNSLATSAVSSSPLTLTSVVNWVLTGDKEEEALRIQQILQLLGNDLVEVNVDINGEYLPPDGKIQRVRKALEL